MTVMNRAQRHYCREVSRLLPCKGSTKRKLMAEIKGNISHYLDDYPDSDYDAIVLRFGTPRQIAASYVEEMEPQDVLHGLRIKKRIVGIIAAGIALVVLVWGIGVAICVVDSINASGGYFEVTIGP